MDGISPAKPLGYDVQALSDTLREAGSHPFHLPLGILLDEKDGRPTPTSPCIRCDAFDGFPGAINAKADAQVICVDPTLAAHSFRQHRRRGRLRRAELGPAAAALGERRPPRRSRQRFEGREEAARRLKHKLEALLEPIGARPILLDRSLYLGKNIPINGTAHQAASIGAVNPTPTIIANALRVADRIEERLGA